MTLTAKYILIDAEGRRLWSDEIRSTASAPNGSLAPEREAAEEAVRQSFQQAISALSRLDPNRLAGSP